MRLWLLRHAPVLAAPGLCYGASDWPADPQATRIAARQLAAQLPRGLRVFSSPLQRCEQLAQAVQALRPDLAYERDDRLREMDFGDWEGKAWSAIERQAFDAWLADFANTPPGGHGESLRVFMARVGSAWDDACASGQSRLWITHAGVIRAAWLLARGQRLPASAADWPSEDVPYAQAIGLQLPSPD